MGSIGSVGSAGSASTNPKAGTTAPPQPMAYGSFTAADKQAAIDNVKPVASKKGVFSNKQREKQAGGAKAPQVETLHEDVAVGGNKSKPHSEGTLLVGSGKLCIDAYGLICELIFVRKLTDDSYNNNFAGLPPRRRSVTPAD